MVEGIEKKTGSEGIKVKHAYDGIRDEVARAGYDPHKYILGMVLSRIEGDDGNCFAWFNLINPKKHKDFFTRAAADSQKKFRTRLEREVSAVEVPESIRKYLQEELDSVNTGDWRDLEVFDNALSKFHRVKDFVKDLRVRDPYLQEACDYHYEIDMRRYLKSE